MNRLHALAVAAAVPALSLLLAARPAHAQETFATVDSIAPVDGTEFILTKVGTTSYYKSVQIILRYRFSSAGTPNTSQSGSQMWSIGYDNTTASFSKAANIAYNANGEWSDTFDKDVWADFYSNGGHHTSGSVGLFYDSSGSTPIASQSLKAHDPNGPIIPFVNDWDRFTLHYPTPANVASNHSFDYLTPLVPLRRHAYAAR